jgi:hypothetical protein
MRRVVKVVRTLSRRTAEPADRPYFHRPATILPCLSCSMARNRIADARRSRGMTRWPRRTGHWSCNELEEDRSP